jgi:serine protease Do
MVASVPQGPHLLIAFDLLRTGPAFLLFVAAIGSAALAAPEPPTSAAERIFAGAPPRLLQIRTLVAGAGQQSSIGSGFLVSADGLAVTNYHVVSQFVLEPKTYRLEYAAADGSHGEVRVLGVDLPNDLAIVRLDKQDAPFFSFDAAAMAGNLAKGQRLYSMGNPLDLGFTISEGHLQRAGRA